MQLEARLFQKSGLLPSHRHWEMGSYVLEKDIPGSGKLAVGLFSSFKDLHFKETEKELRITYFSQVNALRKGR